MRCALITLGVLAAAYFALTVWALVEDYKEPQSA
jgi:hypothetical protein